MLRQITYIELYGSLRTFVSQHPELKANRGKSYIIPELNKFLAGRGCEPVLKEELIYRKALELIHSRYDLAAELSRVAIEFKLSSSDLEEIFNIRQARNLCHVPTKNDAVSSVIRAFKLLASR